MRIAVLTAPARDTPGIVVGSSAVILAVSEEVPRVAVVRRMGHRLAMPARRGSPAGSFVWAVGTGIRGWLAARSCRRFQATAHFRFRAS